MTMRPETREVTFKFNYWDRVSVRQTGWNEPVEYYFAEVVDRWESQDGDHVYKVEMLYEYEHRVVNESMMRTMHPLEQMMLEAKP